MDRDTDFVARLGTPFLAHRLRRVANMFVDGYSRWLPAMGVRVPARSLSTMLLLAELGTAGVTELAARLRLTHPFLIKMVAELQAAGFVATGEDEADARRRPVRLTASGHDEVERIRLALDAIESAYREIFAETGVDLVDAVARVEDACLRDPFHRRLERAAGNQAPTEVQCDIVHSPQS
jgi:DNA-binding MarR family transcriptional regulator